MMLANEPTWTVERLERLKSCFEAGLSCREIADDIGVSRNAVIGKLSRLNLTRGGRSDARGPARSGSCEGTSAWSSAKAGLSDAPGVER